MIWTTRRMLHWCNTLEAGVSLMTTARKAAINRYRQARRHAFAQMAELRERMDAWLDAHEDQEPTMAAMATLEGMHGERLSVVAGLESAERAMIDMLLTSRPDGVVVKD